MDVIIKFGEISFFVLDIFTEQDLIKCLFDRFCTEINYKCGVVVINKNKKRYVFNKVDKYNILDLIRICKLILHKNEDNFEGTIIYNSENLELFLL